MTHTNRSALSAGQKIGIWIAGLFVVWQVLKWPPVFEAMMKFILAGIVPGTHTILSPGAIFEGAVVALIVIALLIVAWPIMRSARYKRRMARLGEADGYVVGETADSGAMTAAAEVVPPPVQATFYAQPIDTQAVDAQPIQAITPPGPTLAWRIGRTLKTTSRYLQTHLAWLWPLLQRTAIKIQASYKAAREHAGPVMHSAAIICKIIWRELHIYARIFRRWSVKQAKDFWRWLEPHLRHFDAWLEIQYRILSKKMARKIQQNDTLSVVAEVSQASKKAVTKLDIGTKARQAKAVTKTATRKAKPYVRKAHATAKKTGASARKRIAKK